MQVDGRPMKRDEFYYSREQVRKEDLERLLSKVIAVHNLALKQSVNNNPYVDFLFAVKLYGKFVEEYDPDWVLLDLVKCLESLGNSHNGLIFGDNLLVEFHDDKVTMWFEGWERFTPHATSISSAFDIVKSFIKKGNGVPKS